jgi:hypothetical protein
MEFLVQPVEMVSDAAHNFNVDVLNATVPCVVYSDGVMPAESLDSGVKLAVAVCATVRDSEEADTAGGGNAMNVIVLVAT